MKQAAGAGPGTFPESSSSFSEAALQRPPVVRLRYRTPRGPVARRTLHPCCGAAQRGGTTWMVNASMSRVA
ncbi:hypothetical protein NDU88_003974 [Pleurodeles waltl]|uniref:Uncharacterized protein n=1 Tax=Pleurodeles waltl TaxID=8319 RepID=A0AAV7PDR5_PLEWA|nr:hypothetical protein NDU88_003974 [Pleurodeles waltl]